MAFESIAHFALCCADKGHTLHLRVRLSSLALWPCRGSAGPLPYYFSLLVGQSLRRGNSKRGRAPSVQGLVFYVVDQLETVEKPKVYFGLEKLFRPKVLSDQ